jgi:two-component system cell cycle sensor histidine kinase/response regulator CckA
MNDTAEDSTTAAQPMGIDGRYYRSLAEEMPGLVCRFRPDGILTFVNENYCRYFGTSAAELIGSNFFAFIPETECRAIRDHYRSLAPGNPEVTQEHRVVLGDGSVRWQRRTDRALFDENKTCREYQSFGEDITASKKADEDRHTLEEQVRQAQKMEAIGLLAGGVAHDFNNILGGIMGYTEILKIKLEAQPELHQYIDRVLASAERASALVKQLLAFARRAPIEMTPCDGHECVRQVIGLLGPLDDRKIAVVKRLEAPAAIIFADCNEIENVLLNIAINARDAMRGGGTLSFETRSTMIDTAVGPDLPVWIRPGPYLLITIADTGSGMDEETRRHLFEPFFTTRKQGKSGGLGLASAYGVIKQHRGYITVTSRVGQGTSFNVLIPQYDPKKCVASGGRA